MKFTLSWLKDHLDTTASLDEISKTLTAIGLEVEHITDRGAALGAFTVAKILHAEKHPEADKLRICKVQSDIGELQIVCGAANARAGITVVLAKEGTIIPANGMVIKKTKIRGVESNGMLCSLEELGLPGASEGIIELANSYTVGSSASAALGVDDPVIEIAITPNRADCLGVIGIARDLAAAGLGKGKERAHFTSKDVWNFYRQSPDARKIESSINVKIESPHCTQFIGIYIQGVKNAPSPDWLKKRLEAVGQRSISALVDITNYLMLDLGRPMHVYDADKLSSNITVRSAKEGEKLNALDGKEYVLSQDMTVIADDSNVLGLAGIIGGSASGCTDDTKNVFLEVAMFDATNIAQTGRKLDILSDARYRFERGVDLQLGLMENANIPNNGMKVELAAYLIHELCGGKVSKAVTQGNEAKWERPIHFNPQRVHKLGGIEIHKDECIRILNALGFNIDEPINGIYTVTPPSWRSDIEGEADLVEEVLRIHGYDNIPTTPLEKIPGVSKPALSHAQKRVHITKRALAARGYAEAVTWSFLPEKQAQMFGGGQPQLKLLNPISADLDMMRPSLLPNLLQAAAKNAARGFKDSFLFEVGLQFTDITLTGQRMVATGIRCGQTVEQHYAGSLFQHKLRPADAFDAKADALALLQTLGLNKCDITTATPGWYHPGRSGALTLGKTILGYFGEVHPAILSEFDLSGPVAAFEIFLDAIPTPRAKGKARASLKPSDFQAVERDFAFIVDGAVTAADMIKALSQADKQLITDIAIFDVYTGTGVESGKKSVAIKITLQAADRTLSEADITTVSTAIIASARSFGGQLRQ